MKANNLVVPPSSRLECEINNISVEILALRNLLPIRIWTSISIERALGQQVGQIKGYKAQKRIEVISEVVPPSSRLECDIST